MTAVVKSRLIVEVTQPTRSVSEAADILSTGEGRK